nr:DUF3592 domain-containing protein [Psychromicrobium silvestre]
MQQEIRLTKDISILADGLVQDKRLAVETQRLVRKFRRLKWFFLVVLILICSGVVSLLVFLTRPTWGGFVEVPATVTSQHHYYYRGDHCQVGVRFSFRGEQRNASFDTSNICTVAPVIGAAVTLAVDPADPSDVLIKGYDGFQRELPYFFGFFGLVFIGLCSAFLRLAMSNERRIRAVGRRGSWMQLTAVVFRRARYRRSVTLILQATGVDRKPELIGLNLPDSWPGVLGLKESSSLSCWIAADGDGQVLLSAPDVVRVYLVGISLPNDFELRAMQS